MKETVGGRVWPSSVVMAGTSDWIRRSRWESGCWGWTRIAIGSMSKLSVSHSPHHIKSIKKTHLYALLESQLIAE